MIDTDELPEDKQEWPCDICGKTLKQRIEEGYDLDKEDVMKDSNIERSGVICPVCKSVIDARIIDFSNDEEFIDEVFSELVDRLKVKITLADNQLKKGEKNEI